MARGQTSQAWPKTLEMRTRGDAGGANWIAWDSVKRWSIWSAGCTP